MGKKTIYCVQPFWKDGRKLAMGAMRQFEREDEAMRTGGVVARRNAGAVVYAVSGDPDCDAWDEPRILATHGQVPPL